jgi:LDH2 family malate/lactate/ureidoglycolate dehydrogenase
MRTESAAYLQAAYEAIWRAHGADDEEARIYAGCFVNADLLGKDTQGIAALPLVYPRIRAGGIRFGEPTEVVKEGPGFALVDGHYGPGQVVATRAMEIAIAKARAATVGIVWVRNTNTFTITSNHAAAALEHDFFGLAACNGVPLVAPWGGRDPVFNTNPLGFAIPAGEELPIIYDGATSAISHGHAVLAARDGRRLEAKTMVGEDGRFTDDPVALVVDPDDRNSEQLGAILPLGAKGFAWLILVDVLAGLMSGMKTAKAIPFHQTAEDPWTGGLFLLAIDVGNLVDLDAFKAKVDALIRTCKASRLAEGFGKIVMPGERAQREAERRRREGVPLREEDWANLARIAGEAGVDLEALRPS